MNNNVRILRLPEVIKMTGLSRGTIYGKIRSGDFPIQLKLGPRSSGWHLHEVESWINSRPRIA